MTSMPNLGGSEMPSFPAPASTQAQTPQKKIIEEVLQIRISQNPQNPKTLNVAFAGEGFDIDDDAIIIDILKTALESYGFTRQPDGSMQA